MNLSMTGIILLCSCISKTDTAFDSDKWKNWVETESTMSLRWDMRKDLIKNHNLVGLTLEEVVNLLGEPDRKSKTEHRYFLGITRDYVDTGSLILEIENGIVISYRVWQG